MSRERFSPSISALPQIDEYVNFYATFDSISSLPKVEIPRANEKGSVITDGRKKEIRFVVYTYIYIYIFIVETGCCRKREERDVKRWKGLERKKERKKKRFTLVFRVSSSVDRHDLSLITLSSMRYVIFIRELVARPFKTRRMESSSILSDISRQGGLGFRFITRPLGLECSRGSIVVNSSAYIGVYTKR